ncbi:MAG: response regulator [Anaerolineae bacterium]|nr:response regulator [Anaerolineae bacterium]
MTQRHILIVDDEPKVGFFLGRSLELSKKDCKVSTARSGEEALEILESSSVDLLITDLRMPGISGLDLIRWVRASSPQTRTILITAYGNEALKTEAQRLKVYHYITKPFNVRDFTEVVDAALKNMVVATPRFTIFSDEAFERITARLNQLMYDINARCIFLSDMQGQRLVEVGPTEGLDNTMLLTLLAGGFATSSELGRQFDNGQTVNLNFQEGERYHIYSVSVGENLIIVIIFDCHVQKSRVGIVWLYARRAVEDLLAVLSTMKAEAPAQLLEDDFSSTLLAELETAFGEEPEAAQPPPKADRMPPAGGVAPQAQPSLDEALPPPNPPAGALPTQPGGALLSIHDAIQQGLLPPDFFEQ